jgi:hypothetical protein
MTPLDDPARDIGAAFKNWVGINLRAREGLLSPVTAQKTLGQCLTEGIVSRSELEAAVSSFLVESDPLVAAPGIYAMMPTLEEIPERLREAMIEIVLLARV